jgi:hypothetical protein
MHTALLSFLLYGFMAQCLDPGATLLLPHQLYGYYQRKKASDVKPSWQLTLIKSSWAISNVRWLKITDVQYGSMM